ncbi:glycosyl hydrolase [Bacillus sp. NP157]|nr:glycosyl hydrolase [Bacillus sp. NP157]
MDEPRSPSRKILAVFATVIGLLTIVALLIPRYTDQIQAAVGRPVVQPFVPGVELWLSTADHRLKLAAQPDVAMAENDGAPADIVIDTDTRYQTMTGFGAAMTDSSAWLLHNKLDAGQRQALLQELYGPPPNLDFNMTRVTIGASDFSLNLYTLDDIPFGQTDLPLKRFNMSVALRDVIPMMRQVMAIHPDMLVIASPWSAPAWMKDSENFIGGQLLEDFESAYADYLIRFVDVYAKHGIPVFALTLQNEPRFTPISYPAMIMTAETRARVIGRYLGPRLAKRTPRVQILEWDHNWSHPEEPLHVLADPKAEPYVDGIAWHCYEGSQYEQGRVHRAYPQKDTYITECSGGDWPISMNGELLWFSRNLLVTGIRQWARGVVYWNVALDENHGPHFGGCALCKGVVTIDSQTGEVTRNDEYYALGHFSRFVPPGSYRLKSTDTDADKGIANVAFENAIDGSVVLVMVNIRTEPRDVSVAEGTRRFTYTMPPESVATFVWNDALAAAWIRRALHWLDSRRPAI